MTHQLFSFLAHTLGLAYFYLRFFARHSWRTSTTPSHSLFNLGNNYCQGLAIPRKGPCLYCCKYLCCVRNLKKKKKVRWAICYGNGYKEGFVHLPFHQLPLLFFVFIVWPIASYIVSHVIRGGQKPVKTDPPDKTARPIRPTARPWVHNGRIRIFIISLIRVSGGPRVLCFLSSGYPPARPLIFN